MKIELLILAICPVLAFLFWIKLKDKYESEPIKILFKYFLLGIIVSIIAFFIEERLILNDFFIGQTYNFYLSFIVAGLVEEGLKFLVLFVFLIKEKEFDEKLDGIIYSIFLALGFACIENILYIIYEEENLVYQVSIMRAIISIPAHICFSTTMGYYLSKYKFESAKIKKRQYLIISFLFPIVFHGAFDFILMIDKKWSIIIFMVYLTFLLKFNLDKLDEYIKSSKKKIRKN